jgi:hypothetical protein
MKSLWALSHDDRYMPKARMIAELKLCDENFSARVHKVQRFGQMQRSMHT